MHKPTKPPISYYGGKQRMAPKIVPLIPPHTVYVEPFAGGAAVMFKKPWPTVTNNHHYREVINDIDGDLVNFYRVLRDPVDGPELCRLLELTPYSKQEYAEAKAGKKTGDQVEDARRYFINQMQSFGNIPHGGWGRGKKGPNLGAKWENKIGGLPDYLDRLAGLHVEHDDALTVIKNWDSPQTFFYCDPPYPKTDQGDYKGYSIEDFQNLIDTLDQCQGSFILSNYDQPEAKFPSGWNRVEFSAKMSAARDKTVNKKRTEVIWYRENKTVPSPDLVKLLRSGKYDCFKGPVNLGDHTE